MAVTVTSLPRTLSGTSFTKRRTGSGAPPNVSPVKKHANISRSMLRTDFFISKQKRSNSLRLGRACSCRWPTFVEPKTMETGDVIFQNNVSDPPLGNKNVDLKFQLEKSTAMSHD